MTASSSKFLHDSIERLLAPLGVRLAWTDASPLHAFATWWLYSNQDSSKLASMESIDGISIVGYSKLDALLSDLRSKISKILVDGHYVANPYLGCRSLEEMQIRCDLLDN
jgi:hypothetical protein